MIRERRLGSIWWTLRLSALWITWSALAGAEAPATANGGREQAATFYDAAVRAFERNEFREAARQFLAADELSPSDDAVSNALVAARRAHDPLLLARAAERGVSRGKDEPELARRAQVALAEAERELARVMLSCAPAPCEMDVDGAPVSPGRARLLPGLHVIGVKVTGGERTTQSLELTAGVERELYLEASPPNVAPAPVTPLPASTPAPQPAPSRALQKPAEPSFARPLFYASLGTTIALAAATTWSGIDALNARSELPGTQADNDAVLARAHRTDALLVGTLLVGAATAYVGFRFLSNPRAREEVAIAAAVGPGAGMISIRGTR